MKVRIMSERRYVPKHKKRYIQRAAAEPRSYHFDVGRNGGNHATHKTESHNSRTMGFVTNMVDTKSSAAMGRSQKVRLKSAYAGAKKRP